MPPLCPLNRMLDFDKFDSIAPCYHPFEHWRPKVHNIARDDARRPFPFGYCLAAAFPA
jgi:hypothetical protein